MKRTANNGISAAICQRLKRVNVAVSSLIDMSELNDSVLSRITVYPIKALAGVCVDEVEITTGGTLKNDRRWAIMDRKGRPINGKNSRRIYSLKATFDLNIGHVFFKDEKQGLLSFDLNNTAELSAYLSEQLNKSVTVHENVTEGFPDDPNAYGPTLVSEASLLQVMSWYPGLSLDEIRARFRINLEVSPAPAFWEDRCFVADAEPKAVCVGNVVIQSTNPCARCAVPMKASSNGEPYEDFFETFVENRLKTKTAWTDAACFDHWYRLSINTKIAYAEAGKVITLGDRVSIAG